MRRLIVVISVAAVLTMLWPALSLAAKGNGKGMRQREGNGTRQVERKRDGSCDGSGTCEGQRKGQQQRQRKRDGSGDCPRDGSSCNGPDDDGDGIPNGQDPDYQRPRDGSGPRRGAR